MKALSVGVVLKALEGFVTLFLITAVLTYLARNQLWIDEPAMWLITQGAACVGAVLYGVAYLVKRRESYPYEDTLS